MMSAQLPVAGLALTATPLIPLDASAALDPARCGNKAATLARLRQQGFDVPEGLVLPVAAVATREQVAAALSSLGGPVAVRSSGTAEDGPHASWAGQYETFLGVEGADAALHAIGACLASARSPRARAYAASHGVDAGVAVLIQRMVPAEQAGVAFSANPITGDVGECLVSATRGLGDRLVAGEAAADEWTVRDGIATARATPQGALDAAAVGEVAALARRVAEALGAPQDIEWARAGGRLTLLQARPIVDLPLAPRVVAPSGNWTKDVSFFSGPVTPLGATAYLAGMGSAIATMCREWGLIPDGVDSTCVGHESYSQMVPDDVSAPPPWWVLGVVARLIPSIRRKLRRSREVVEAGWLDAVPAAWEDHVRAELAERLARFGAADLSGLDDAGLLAHWEALMAFMPEALEVHFRLFIPYCVGVHELHQVCHELLGWAPEASIELLQGLSPASSEPTRALRALADELARRPAAREVVMRADPTLLDDLDEVDPEAARRIRGYLDRWGWRCVDYDPGVPTLAEQPERVAELLAELWQDRPARDLLAQRRARVEAVRAQLDPAQRARFDARLAYAERVYPQREDNIIYTDSLPGGAIRRAALELGRRLTARGHLAHPRDVAYLERAELEALADPPRDLAARAERRRREMAWVRAHPGPLVLGKPPGASPNVRGLPAPARRINGALLWMFDLEHRPPQEPEGAGLAGLPASGGTYRGRVRVVRDARALHELQRGEVLVCPITSPAWSVYFSRAGALVTDSGSVLSHAAIIAREHSVPAVVATTDGTSRLRDGMDVTVDGSRGVVLIHDAPR